MVDSGIEFAEEMLLVGESADRTDLVQDASVFRLRTLQQHGDPAVFSPSGLATPKAEGTC